MKEKKKQAKEKTDKGGINNEMKIITISLSR
jgi:hypothetical protein